MKKTLCLIFAVGALISCKKETQENKNTAVTTEAQTETQTETQVDSNASNFDLNTIPVSDIDLGDFPFFTAPKDAKYINNVKPKDFDFVVFVTPNEIFEVEGKTFRAWVHPENGKDISGRYLFKSYDDAIIKAGGVKIFEGNLKEERLEKYNELVTYKGSDGTFIPSDDSQLVAYVINHKSGPIYIILEKKDFGTSSIQIVQSAAFEQTIEKITSDQIVDDLTKTGKSILYINFDVDKATLTADGNNIVNEIAEGLKNNPSLKINIEGHTDDSGDKTQNKKLSMQRSEAVVSALQSKGITKDRLVAKGFGAEKPLVSNDTEENKAKNRRVELVKI